MRLAGASGRRSSRCPGSCTTSAPPSIPSRRSPRPSDRCRSPSTASSGCGRRSCSHIPWPMGQRPPSSTTWRKPRALGPDGDAYRALIGGIVERWAQIESAVLGPPRWPRHPIALARFGAERAAIGAGAGVAPFRRRAHARPVRWPGGARVAAARAPDHRGFRSRARHDRPPCWLGVSTRGGGAARGCARVVPAVARRRSGDEQADRVTRRAATGACDSVRFVAGAVSPDCRRPSPARLSPEAGPLSLRDGRLQGGLGLERADSLDGPRVQAGGNRPRRRNTRGDCGKRARGLGRTNSRIGRSCSWHSTRRSTRRVRPRDGTRPGRTVTCPTARP